MTIDDAAFEVSVPYYVENAQALLGILKPGSVIKKTITIKKYIGQMLLIKLKILLKWRFMCLKRIRRSYESKKKSD